MFRPLGLLATQVVPTSAQPIGPAGYRRFRVRWVIQRFRTGPQSDSRGPDPPPFPALGSRGFYVHAYLGPLPRRAVDMLAVRIEQLTAEGLSPSKTRGSAGRS